MLGTVVLPVCLRPPDGGAGLQEGWVTPHASMVKPSWKPQEYGHPESFPAGRLGRVGAGRKVHRRDHGTPRPSPCCSPLAHLFCTRSPAWSHVPCVIHQGTVSQRFLTAGSHSRTPWDPRRGPGISYLCHRRRPGLEIGIAGGLGQSWEAERRLCPV